MRHPEGTGAPVRVLCAGIAVFDHVYRLRRFPEPGTKTRAQEFIAVGGGCAANAAVAVARLGGHAALAAPLGGPAGHDGVGDQILSGLARETVDCSVCAPRSGDFAYLGHPGGRRGRAADRQSP